MEYMYRVGMALRYSCSIKKVQVLKKTDKTLLWTDDREREELEHINAKAHRFFETAIQAKTFAKGEHRSQIKELNSYLERINAKQKLIDKFED